MARNFLNFQVFVTLRACTPIAEMIMTCLKTNYLTLSDYHLAKLMVLCSKEVYDTDPNYIVYTCPSTLSYVSSFSPLCVCTFPPVPSGFTFSSSSLWGLNHLLDAAPFAR